MQCPPGFRLGLLQQLPQARRVGIQARELFGIRIGPVPLSVLGIERSQRLENAGIDTVEPVGFEIHSLRLLAPAEFL
jgi:hypothetical protein